MSERVAAGRRSPPNGAASKSMARDREDDPRLLEELQLAAEFLHRQGCGDGAVAVREAIRRL